MTTVLPILHYAKGLNVKDDPARLYYHAKKGIQTLAVAVNIDIDGSGRVSRRKGFAQRLAGNFHSLFAGKDTVVCVTGDALSILDTVGYVTTPIRNVTVGARMSYCEVDDRIFYTNRYETGYIQNGTSWSWVAGTYVGPTTCVERSDPPIGSHIEHYRGRIYVAQGDTLWFSEPYDYNAFNLHRDFLQFDGIIKMVRAVTAGIFVATNKATYFLLGDRADEGFVRVQVAGYSVVEYSDVPFQGKVTTTDDNEFILVSSLDDQAAIWTSTKGICYGGPDGRFVNLTMDAIEMPPAALGCGMIVDGDTYIGLVEP